MPDDDELPRPKPALLGRPVLDRLSVDELEAYVADLRAEIARVEAEAVRKRATRDAANAFFRGG